MTHVWWATVPDLDIMNLGESGEHVVRARLVQQPRALEGRQLRGRCVAPQPRTHVDVQARRTRLNKCRGGCTAIMQQRAAHRVAQDHLRHVATAAKSAHKVAWPCHCIVKLFQNQNSEPSIDVQACTECLHLLDSHCCVSHLHLPQPPKVKMLLHEVRATDASQTGLPAASKLKSMPHQHVPYT